MTATLEVNDNVMRLLAKLGWVPQNEVVHAISRAKGAIAHADYELCHSRTIAKTQEAIEQALLRLANLGYVTQIQRVNIMALLKLGPEVSQLRNEDFDENERAYWVRVADECEGALMTAEYLSAIAPHSAA